MRAEEAARRALAAVARLTILAGAAGCAGNVVVNEEKEAAASPDPGEAIPGLPPGFAMDPPGADCFDDAAGAASCCDALLLESFTEGPLLSDPSLATDEERACCDLAVATMDAWMGEGDPPFALSTPTNCCAAGLVEGGWEAHPSCTPWGPPMPPAMPRGFDLFAPEVVA